ncbi:MAG: hypothetical protein A2381_19570 [Bdellovibrionales bacterium RIFOXYB1_FULL_37_110]|nr:MAG: hypothetical protein A2417_11070 [Bdellovibrionales bacterium RIFOXYC1_FULL_37_79]OFZ60679.1 MAG: hypothetical protein A2381_19570 [Bdellovibrionales bacterium RIFOXYB1_FULL_37_110]OFZ64431.1 MAG: hypothetical protein A2577_10220 [Bdellovibrionales bacterium RIFOXYD1_FULL_36_51]
MNILIVFGSKSDQRVYDPLVSVLSKSHSIQFDILSAHRNPIELDLLLKTKAFDLIIAGAGLAAHLPGVVASKVDTPVIGLPINASLAGLDATLSILQMPFMVPVITCAPDRHMEVVSFINLLKERKKSESEKSICIVFNKTFDSLIYQSEIDRTLLFAKENAIKVSLVDCFDASKLNVILVTQKEDIQKDVLAIHVPLFNQHENANPETSIKLFNWISLGGMWVGINNTRNALIYYQKLFLRRNI